LLADPTVGKVRRPCPIQKEEKSQQLGHWRLISRLVEPVANKSLCGVLFVLDEERINK